MFGFDSFKADRVKRKGYIFNNKTKELGRDPFVVF